MGKSANTVSNQESAARAQNRDQNSFEKDSSFKEMALIDMQEYQRSLLEEEIDNKFQDYETLSQFHRLDSDEHVKESRRTALINLGQPCSAEWLTASLIVLHIQSEDQIESLNQMAKVLQGVSLSKTHVLVCLDLEDYCTDDNPLQKTLSTLDEILSRQCQERTEEPWLLFTTSKQTMFLHLGLWIGRANQQPDPQEAFATPIVFTGSPENFESLKPQVKLFSPDSIPNVNMPQHLHPFGQFKNVGMRQEEQQPHGFQNMQFKTFNEEQDYQTNDPNELSPFEKEQVVMIFRKFSKQLLSAPPNSFSTIDKIIKTIQNLVTQHQRAQSSKRSFTRLNLDFFIIRDLFLSGLIESPLVNRAILSNQITSLADFTGLYQITFGTQFQAQLDTWKAEIEQSKKKLEEQERMESFFNRGEGQDIKVELSQNDESGLKRIRFGVQELLLKFGQGLTGGQDEVRPKKSGKLVKMLKNLLDGILKKVELQMPNAFKTLVIANAFNILLFREVITFVEKRQDSIDYAEGEDLEIKLQLCKHDDFWLVLPNTEVEVPNFPSAEQPGQTHTVKMKSEDWAQAMLVQASTHMFNPAPSRPAQSLKKPIEQPEAKMKKPKQQKAQGQQSAREAKAQGASEEFRHVGGQKVKLFRPYDQQHQDGENPQHTGQEPADAANRPHSGQPPQNPRRYQKKFKQQQ